MSHATIKAAEELLGVRLEHAGDLSLLDRPRRTLLISRAERNPNPQTPWLENALAATQDLLHRDEVLVTGSGRTAFDAILWKCAHSSGSAIVALQSPPADHNDINAFLPARNLLVWPRESKKKPASRQRDLLMAALADRASSIWIRKSGNMADLASLLAGRGCPVELYSPPHHPPAGTAAANDIRIQGASIMTRTLPADPGAGSWEYLAHFTREPDGAYPGEHRVDYLRWLCGGAPFQPRNAFSSLKRILSEKRVRACGRLMPGGAPMVCFTALHPARAYTLRRWRPGLLRWSFEKHALLIRKSVLLQLGARQVAYVPRQQIESANGHEQPYMQVQRSKDIDWSQECEWRIAGDVNLCGISPDDMLAVTDSSECAAKIEREFRIKTHVL